MTSRQLILLLVTPIGLGIIFTAGKLLVDKTRGVPETGEAVACTLDAMICPDGSAVGRIPPSCQFAQCPVGSATSTTSAGAGTTTAALGQKVGTAVAITPLEVIEDSRCPANVQCIQAGTVRLRASVSVNNTASTTQILKLNEAFKIEGRTITLVDVTPSTTAGTQIASKNYRFTFDIK